MKNYKVIVALAFGALFMQGCIAFPPLIQVEHKSDAPAAAAPASNDEVLRRLDAIDSRLNQLEKSHSK